MLDWLARNAVGLGMLGTAIGFLWSAVRVVIDRRRDLQFREFEAYHRLVKELVQPDAESGSTWVDRQAAVIFELGNYPRYYECTARMLTDLNQRWSEWPRLEAEIDLTLSHIDGARSRRSRRAGARG